MKLPTSSHRSEIYEDKWMTPMIDIVILLLIFLVCASAAMSPEAMFPTKLAPGGTVPAGPEVPVVEQKWSTPIWLNLKRVPGKAETVVAMNDRDYDDFGLLQSQLLTLAEVAPDSPVILDIAPDVSLGELIKVWDTCRSAKFQTIQFAADASKVKPNGEPAK